MIEKYDAFQYWYGQLPKEIIVDNKHYNLFITPYDITYMAFDDERKYIIHKIVEVDLTIEDEYGRLLNMMKRMNDIIKKDKT